MNIKKSIIRQKLYEECEKIKDKDIFDLSAKEKLTIIKFMLNISDQKLAKLLNISRMTMYYILKNKTVKYFTEDKLTDFFCSIIFEEKN